MNWYKGNIAEAVAESKRKNAIFVVFVEGKDETTQKLNKFIDDEKIRSKLESDHFVAIKIESESEAYMQFATIYQVVPVPSIFFIGKSGAPLEIGTGVIASVDELEQKIDKVLATTNSGSASSSSTTSFIAAEQAAGTTPTQSSAAAPQVAEDEIVCEGDVCYKKPKAAATKIDSAKAEETKAQQETAEVSAAAAAATSTTNVVETRKLLEQKRRERIAAEQKAEKERELERRKSGRDMQNQQQYQKEQVLKELKENLRRERLEEQTVRDRIRAQIAGDRAERAHKFSTETTEMGGAAAPAASSAPKPVPQASDVARLQFRLSNGESKMHSFNCQETLSTVRSYVKTEILPGTGIRGDFILATTYPKRELAAEHETKTLVELELFPSAVILVIGKESKLSPNAIISRSGGLVNMFTTLFWALLSPAFAIFGYMKNIVAGGGAKNGEDNTGAQKRANEEQGPRQDAAKRRNLDRFLSNNDASTSKEATAAATDASAAGGESKPYRRYGSSNVHRLTDQRKDSDDENATWNGNSTQQQ